MPLVTEVENTREETANYLSNARSEQLQEIISQRSGFLTRWALVFFVAVLLMLLAGSWFLQYPDTIQVKAQLSSINSPKTVICLTNGKLIKLSISENQSVKKNQILGYIESTANHNEVIKLSEEIEKIRTLLENGKENKLPVFFNKTFTNLGELQPAYQAFSQAFIVYKDYLSNSFYPRKKAMLEKDKENLQKLHSNLLAQKELNEQDLVLAKRTFEVNQSLSNDKVISDLDYRNEMSKLIGKKLTIPQINSLIINNESQQNDKTKEIAELDKTINQQRSIFLQASNTFKSQLDDWKRKYLLIAPIDGKVSFASIIQENQQLQANQIVSYINPENTEYYAQIIVPQSNFGKVHQGQKVLLRFPSYPFQEFGFVHGEIEFISHIASDSGYFAKVRLPNGLLTTYNNKIQYRTGLKAQGEIITKNMRLIERFYLNTIAQLKRK